MNAHIQINKRNSWNTSSEFVKQEFSGSFEMINNEIEQEFQASANGTGKFYSFIFYVSLNFFLNF